MKMGQFKTAARFCMAVLSAWSHHKMPRLGAALAFYTLFAAAPLFLIAVAVAGLWFGQKEASQELFNQIKIWLGDESARAILSLVTAANRPAAGLWATVAALGTMGAGATAVFIELQDALNTIWRVQPKPGQGIRDFIRCRLLSFVMVLLVGFLLLVQIILDAALTALGTFAAGPMMHLHLWGALNFVVSLGVTTLLFALIFKVLPAVKIAWRDVWMGAFVTAVLFAAGKFLIGWYLGRGGLVSVYGAAASFIVLLLWVYYSAQIIFLGAEFTRLYAEQRCRTAGPGR
jgi:membrane protein